MIHLFEQFPDLREKLPYVSLGDFPTPVRRLCALEKRLGSGELYIKHDDLSGPYGGNKTRKLEFLLGQALRRHARSVITVGYAGSNHALACAYYGRQLGLRCISTLLLQPNARYVRNNLLLSHLFGAELHHYRNELPYVLGSLFQLVEHGLRDGAFPLYIPAGGSSLLGNAGYVNAAFELKAQIDQGLMPEPACLYVAAGTLGTTVGLIVGLKAAGLRTRVVAVRVVRRIYATKYIILQQARRLNAYLHRLDPQFPRCDITSQDFDLRHGFFGRAYALFTTQGMQAVALLETLENIPIEGTYTGKTMAAFIADSSGSNPGCTAPRLFWNTHNSRDFSAQIKPLDYHRLPAPFHYYFEHDVQPLDFPAGRAGEWEGGEP